MANKGWVSIHRNLYDHWIWNSNEPFDKRSAWIDLILMVNHEDKTVLINNNLITVKRGQRITSLAKLSKRWKWSRKKVTTFLKNLEKDDMIGLEMEQGKHTTITIVNYSFYQDSNIDKSTSEEQPKNNSSTSEEQ
ncbi:MAG: DNA replication protein DnaD, partial [Peptoniphilus sp.]